MGKGEDFGRIMRESPKPGVGGILPGEVVISEAEKKILNIMRNNVPYGSITITMKDGKPVEITKVERIRLD